MTSFAIVVYEGVEPIDIGATFGVLSMARRVDSDIAMFLVARRAGVVQLASGLPVVAAHGFHDCPPADAVIVTGGPGWSQASKEPEMLEFLRARAAATPVVASVCTGAMLLAAAGLLDGHRATTKREVIGTEVPPIAILRDSYPRVRAVPARVVDEGAVVTGGGVTLAIDLTLHLLERLRGPEVAAETARIIEYAVAWRANRAAWSSA